MSSVKAFKWCWLAIIILQYWYNESYSYPLIVPNEKIYFLDSHGLRRELADKLDFLPTALHAAYKVDNKRGVACKRGEDYIIHNTEHENSNHINMERGPTAYQEPDRCRNHTQIVKKEHYQPSYQPKARIQNVNVEIPSESDNKQMPYDTNVPLVIPLSEEDRIQVSERQNGRTYVDNEIGLPSEEYVKQALHDLALRIKQMIYQDDIKSDSNNRNPINKFSD